MAKYRMRAVMKHLYQQRLELVRKYALTHHYLMSKPAEWKLPMPDNEEDK